jgi:DNA (cytosine-5)-methyltransferase 1
MSGEAGAFIPPRRPRLIDLGCGAGGAAWGYWLAGFDVYGVDIKPQPNYPFWFKRADFLEFPLEGFDAAHSSPPCQAYSMGTRNFGTAGRHPRLVEPMQARLRAFGLPYVLENVPGAPLVNYIQLCGTMFGLGVRRHRLFEVNFSIAEMTPACAHVGIPIGVYGRGTNSWHRKKLGRDTTKDDWRSAMGIDWMQTRRELANAIPPAYTLWIGRQLMARLLAEKAA